MQQIIREAASGTAFRQAPNIYGLSATVMEQPTGFTIPRAIPNGVRWFSCTAPSARAIRSTPARMCGPLSVCWRGATLLALNVRGTSYMNPATAADTHALLGWARRELGLNQITLLGGSGGAISALIYGLLYPDDVQGIITLGACDLARWYAFLARGGAPILDTLAETVRAAYGGTPDEAPALYQAHSVLAHADRITVPTVLTHGEADTLIPVEEARAVAAALAGNAEFRYIEVPGGDHDSAVWVDVDLETLEVREG